MKKNSTMALGVALAISLILIGVLFGRMRQTEGAIAELTEQLVTVESGAAYALAQLGILEGALGDLGPGATEALDEAITGLDNFATSTLTVDIAVDETVPINTQFLLQRDLIVPIQTSVPISQVIDTTITIAGPLGTEILLDISVPVDIVIPINIEVPIPINETIDIDVEVPITLDIPVEIDVAGTELATFAESLRSGLQAFRDALSQLGTS